MSQWGMELWLQACTTHQRKKLEEATRRTEKKEDAESKGKKGALVQHYLETRGKNGNRTVKSSNSSLVTSNDQVSGYDSTVRTLHPARSRAVSDTAEDPVAQGHVLLNPLGLPLPGTAHSDLRTDDNTAKELRELAILPVDGFVALFHLLPREKCESGAQMQSLFTECVQEYLTQQLHDTLRQEGDKGSTVFPHSVFESCRLALQLTIAVFMDMDDRTELSVMGHVADMAVQAAIQTFFAANAVPAAQTIALALNAHVVEGGTTQDLDALLKLASLLPSRELFVRLYKALVAPRVVSVTSLEEIAADTVVLDKLERVLGTTVAAPCLTLFRDLKQSIKEETPAAVTETTTSVAMLTRLGLTSAPSSQLDNAVGSSFLLRSVRVLCEAWWGPHTPVLLPSHKIKRLFEKSNWFDATFVNAVLRLEWYYRREEDGEAYQPFDAEPPTTASDTKEGPSTSFSTSAMVKDISSAIGSAVNGNRWYGNLRRTERQSGAFGYEDPDEDADFSEAYGGLLPAAGGMNDWRSLSSMGDRHTEQESTVASIPVGWGAREETAQVVSHEWGADVSFLSSRPGQLPWK
ncbi:hypothetical protein AGDE_14749 [Angomonas deanei]|uniref:Cullin family profile domain-containing protein n=1 Tax=Angomonas deanei TaxID=59799 RepID=A0A7G2C712_9TRYP|nr:hypothetical protein AGDE_14749 [Angomonas deanei]CAD2214543.1 hypothetical protein, conserved [Angomonas deanei]|eukprot:EPY20293.1 hypothetical protein AGDE_14749 [Angomonas deanei]